MDPLASASAAAAAHVGRHERMLLRQDVVDLLSTASTTGFNFDRFKAMRLAETAAGGGGAESAVPSGRW